VDVRVFCECLRLFPSPCLSRGAYGFQVKHRGAEYEALKAGFKDRLLRVLLTQFPTLRAPGVIAHASVGSPLSSAYYLGSARGASYGIAHTPARFHVDWLEPATPVRGLYLAGQDIATCGVAGGAIGGVLAAMATSNRVALGTAGLLVEGIV
jgi:all-trans-retinol 13,14-reductase